MALLGAAPSGQDNAFKILHAYSTKKPGRNCGLVFLLNERIEFLAVAHPQYLLLVTLADDEVVHAQGPSRGLRQRQFLSACVSNDRFRAVSKFVYTFGVYLWG